jgi:hypothetical protein
MITASAAAPLTARRLVAGRGEAALADRKRFDAPALKAIRYADPAAWIAAAAVADALRPVREAVAAAQDRTGVVAVSAEGPVEAMAGMYEASREGVSSPIRFPASNAGSLAGLTSIALSLRGPTLMLTLPPDRGVPVGLLLAGAWIERGVVSFVALTACGLREGRPFSRCLLLGGDGAPLDQTADVAWLVEAG